MSSFDARLRLPGQSRLPLGVEVDVTSDRVTVVSEDRTVAIWNRNELVIDAQADGFHITVDGEVAILNVTDSARFAAALDVPRFVKRAASLGGHRPTQTPVATAPTTQATANGNGAPAPSETAANRVADSVDDYEGRVAEVAAALKSDSVSAAQAFGKWVRLLKEINHRHGQGSMPTDQFFQLNTTILDLIPEPKPPADAG